MALHIRTFTFSANKKLPPPAAALLVVGIGALLVALGLTLLAGLAVVGTVGGAGFLGYRALRGRVDRVLGRGQPVHPEPALDPANEVFPPTRQIKGG